MPSAKTWSPEDVKAFIATLTPEQRIAFMAEPIARKAATKKNTNPTRTWMTKESKQAVLELLMKETGYDSDPEVQARVNEKAATRVEEIKRERAELAAKMKAGKAKAVKGPVVAKKTA